MKLGLLVMTPGKQEGKLIEIKLPQFVVGRDPQCHLRPASPLISKRHCMLIQKDGKAFIRDFDSTNGTFVNDDPVKGERELHNDDQLKIGPIAFTVRLVQEAAPARTPAPPTKPATVKTPAPPTKADAGKTPLPATTSKPAAARSGGAEDDIAAMLLELEGDASSSSESGESPRVPDGSTVMDLKVPPEGAAPPGKEEPKKPAKPATGNTQSAAASILEKMMKRPRA